VAGGGVASAAALSRRSYVARLMKRRGQVGSQCMISEWSCYGVEPKPHSRGQATQVS
jgi:hypothetical protein